MNWLGIGIVLVMLWILLGILVVAFYFKRGFTFLQTLSNIIVGTFPRQLVLYESMTVISLLSLGIYQYERLDGQSLFSIILNPYWLYIWVSMLLTMFYLAGMTSDIQRRYVSVLKKLLNKADYPEAVIAEIIEQYNEDSGDEINSSTFKALIYLSDEPTTLGVLIKTKLDEFQTDKDSE